MTGATSPPGDLFINVQLNGPMIGGGLVFSPPGWTVNGVPATRLDWSDGDTFVTVAALTEIEAGQVIENDGSLDPPPIDAGSAIAA